LLHNAVLEKILIAVRLSATVQLRQEIIIHKETEGSSNSDTRYSM